MNITADKLTRTDSDKSSILTYRLKNASLDNSGRYFCSAGCSAKATYSTHTNIELLYIKSDGDQPVTAQGVEVGQSATFTCTITLPSNFPESSGPSSFSLEPQDEGSLVSLPSQHVTTTFGEDSLQISAIYPITLLSQGGKKYKLHILFDKIDGKGTIKTSDSLLVVQVVNNTATHLVGVEGLPGVCKCSGQSVIKAVKAYVIKDKNEDVVIGETTVITFDDTEKLNTADISIPSLNADSMGKYSCVMQFDKGPVISEQTTEVKVLYIEVEPPTFFAGPRGKSATVSCLISYPEMEAFPMTLPTTKWYQTGKDAEGNPLQLPLQSDDQVTLVIDPNFSKGWENATGVNRKLESTLTIDECDEEHTYAMEFNYNEFPDKKFTTTPTTLIILDVNMTMSTMYAVKGADAAVTCTAFDAKPVKSYTWYRNSALYSGGSGKQSMRYNTKLGRSEILVEWLGVLVEEEGVYHCDAVFESGLSMSAARSSSTQTTTLSVLRIIDELPRLVYLTPGDQSSVSCTCLLPKDLPIPTILVKSTVTDQPDFNQTSELLVGAREVVNNQDLYKITFTTPLPSPEEGVKYTVEVTYLNVSQTLPIKTEISSEVKTRKVRMSKVDLNKAGTGWYNYYATEGSYLLLTCEAESNKEVNFSNYNYTITLKDTDKTKIEVDYKTAANHSMQVVTETDYDRTNYMTYVTLNISNIDNTYDKAKVGCTVLFADEGGSNITSATTAEATIHILLLKTQPKSYGFQRENGISTEIFAEFQNSESTVQLSYQYYWVSSNTSLYRPEYEERVDDKYVVSSVFKTELQIVVNSETKDRYYWAVLEFNKGLLQITGSNNITTNKAYIIVNELCSNTTNVKFQQFPPTANIDLSSISYDVGDLLLIYGTVNLEYVDSQGKAVSETEFYIGCPQYLPLLKFNVDGTNAQVALQKLSGTCNSEKEGVEQTLVIRNTGISLIAMVATETQFLVWSSKGGKAIKLPIKYTPVAGQAADIEEDQIKYMTDNEKVKVFYLVS